MDSISKERRSANMRAIKSKNTKPELIVRQALHALGYRYTLHNKNYPGKPDLVFPKRKKAIFVHGCFWHQHTKAGCKIARVPKSNLEFWNGKLQKTVARDQNHISGLENAGWEVLIIWECDIEESSRWLDEAVHFLESARHCFQDTAGVTSSASLNHLKSD